jgi:hypothetical protein
VPDRARGSGGTSGGSAAAPAATTPADQAVALLLLSEVMPISCRTESSGQKQKFGQGRC